MAGTTALPTLARAQSRPGETARQRAEGPAASRHYRFTRIAFVSEDGERRYRLTLGVPQRTAGKDGYPLALLLDGNAVLDTLDPPLLAQLDATGRPPVIAALGYETAENFAITARTHDYTPPHPGQGNSSRDPVHGGPTGGANAFLALIEQTIKPKINATIRIDTTRQTLWGHGHGGLFALHVLFTNPAAFNRYAVANPTLWWNDGQILRTEAAPARLPRREVRLFVMSGTGADRRGPSIDLPDTDPASAARLAEARRAVPPEALQRLIERQARRPGLVTTQQVFQGMPHQRLFAASIEPALRFSTRY